MDQNVSELRAHTADLAALALERLRQARPLVQNITNYVAMDIAANALLAIGASPAMVHAREELEEFVGFSGALVINIGTLSGAWVESMVEAARAARASGTPWVLDPVGVGATRFRNETVALLMAEKPTVVRGNASEILAVAKVMGLTDLAGRSKGVDSGNSTEEAVDAAKLLAEHTGAVVVATGAVDVVAGRGRLIRLANGSPLMTRVTAVGCSLSAIVGAFVATTADPVDAAVAAVAVTGIAGELAARDAALPGSFRVAFLDRLASVDGDAVRDTLKIAEA